MKTNIRTFFIISRLLFLRMRTVLNKSCSEIRTPHFMFNNFFPRKSCRLWYNVEKHGRAGQVTDGNIIRRVHFARWKTKATNTHTECVILIALRRQQWFTNASQCYVIPILPVLCFSILINAGELRYII
jgi:hypothetical protein